MLLEGEAKHVASCGAKAKIRKSKRKRTPLAACNVIFCVESRRLKFSASFRPPPPHTKFACSRFIAIVIVSLSCLSEFLNLLGITHHGSTHPPNVDGKLFGGSSFSAVSREGRSGDDLMIGAGFDFRAIRDDAGVLGD